MLSIDETSARLIYDDDLSFKVMMSIESEHYQHN